MLLGADTEVCVHRCPRGRLGAEVRIRSAKHVGLGKALVGAAPHPHFHVSWYQYVPAFKAPLGTQIWHFSSEIRKCKVSLA